MLKFGKHKNQSIPSIIKSDPKYILWLAQQDWVDNGIVEEIQTFANRIIMPFGKHEGMTINQLRNVDPEYVDWLFSNSRIN